MKVFRRVIPLINNVSSVQRLVDAAKLAYSLGFNTFIATNVYGAAAQNGIPEVTKLAFKTSNNFMVFSSLSDVKELFADHLIYTITPRANHGLEILAEELGKDSNINIIVAVNGIEQDFTSDELQGTKSVWITHRKNRLGPLPELAITLYRIIECCMEENDKNQI